MPQDNRGPSSRGGKPGGGRDGRPGGGKRGGPPGKSDRAPVRVEAYETVKELQRGTGFRIDKSVVADKATHKPIKTEYRLTREGLAGTQVFGRLADALTASTAPLPEPEAAPAPAEEAEAPASDTPAEPSEPEA